MNNRNFKTRRSYAHPACKLCAHLFPEARLRCKVKNGDFTSFGCAQTLLDFLVLLFFNSVNIILRTCPGAHFLDHTLNNTNMDILRCFPDLVIPPFDFWRPTVGPTWRFVMTRSNFHRHFLINDGRVHIPLRLGNFNLKWTNQQRDQFFIACCLFIFFFPCEYMLVRESWPMCN